ncbi:MAG TPA: hypothetical protein QGH10_24330, partial [Armatimonadota bacterium]|nr:hypothetical protein [Armatimonadota bacterium]
MLKRAATCVILIGAAASSALASFSSGPSAPPTPPTALGFAHFTTWGLVPFVGAWATWHMMETLRGSLLH